MKIRCLLLVFIIIAAFGGVTAQDRTITNSDLVKYTQDRIKAEAELRENYLKLGFGSPRSANDGTPNLQRKRQRYLQGSGQNELSVSG